MQQLNNLCDRLVIEILSATWGLKKLIEDLELNKSMAVDNYKVIIVIGYFILVWSLRDMFFL